MGAQLKLRALCLALCTSLVFSLPAVTDSDSLIVSSTEPPKEESSDTSVKENAVPSVPKIYEMKVEANVTNRFAKTAVISRVKNLAKTAQEATFSVVLPETAYISGFVMEIGGKSYKAYVKEKEEAKKIYTEAIESGQAAAHVEANARDSNRFTVSVNVEPQSKAIFTLTYEELLQRQNEQYEVVINIHPGQPVKDLSVEVNINETRPLKFVRSPSLRSGNEISKNEENLSPQAEIDINSTAATVKFSPDIEKQKQLATGLGTKEENGLSGQFIVQYDVERDPQGGEVLVKDGYFVHFFAPEDLPPLPKQVVFVLDTSGSMDGIRIVQLKEAMNSILAELKKEDIFNIVEFSSTVRVWNIENTQVDYELGEDPWATYRDLESKPQEKKTDKVLPPAYPATEENIKKAKEVVGKLNAYGGTDIKSALEVGLNVIKKNKEDKNDTHQPIIIFLTDGEPTVGETYPDKIISSIAEFNSGANRSPIFSLSFGDGADRDFLQKISLKNLGFARHIYEAADASLQLQEFYREISSPLLSDVNFKYVSNVTKLTRTQFPIFFHGSELVIAGSVPLDQEFTPPTIYGHGFRGRVELVPKVVNPVGDLERLWAYLTIKQILEARDAAENKTLYTKKALDIALKYSFVTPVSSLVVVKPNDTSAVDTQDASKSSSDRPYFLNQNNYALGGAGYSGAFGAPARPAYFNRPALGTAAVQLAAVPESAVLLEEEAFAYEATEQPQLLTTLIPSLYEDLKTQLPWLEGILSDNGTFTSPAGDYQVSFDATVSNQTECSKTPTNGTAGICTLLPNCPQVFSYLTSAEIFQEYFCTLDIIYVGVCCPSSKDEA